MVSFSHPRARFLSALHIALLLSLSALSVLVLAAPNFPALSGRVVDQANVLDASMRTSIASTLAAHEDKTGQQVVVVTLSSLEGYDISEYGYQLGRHWGIGQQEANNGVLFIIAPTERKVRIEVGYGVEGVLTDGLSHQIIQQNVLPAFRRMDYPGGIQAGVSQIVHWLAADPEALRDRQAAAQQLEQQSGLTGVFLLVLFFLAPMLRSVSKRFGEKVMFAGALVAGGITWWLTLQVLFALFVAAFFWVASLGRTGALVSGGHSGGGGFGGGGLGGGGFSGGGGSFGGGGASGGW
ncbi:MAG: TPM domain-containing protein [Pseudomonadota bacterium]